MKIIKIALPILFVIVLVLGFLAPIGPLPGFFIGGNETPVPESWQDTSQLNEIRLKIPGSIPRVVVIWVIDFDGDLFVVGNQGSVWVEMLGTGGPVDLRIESSTYQVTASQLKVGWEPIMQKYIDKYQAEYPEIIEGFPSLEEAQSQIAVFRLEG